MATRHPGDRRPRSTAGSGRACAPTMASTVAQDALFDHAHDLRATSARQVLRTPASGERGVPRCSPPEVLEFATVEGARCANLADRVGTLTPGKEADLVLLRADQASLWPMSNAAGTVANMIIRNVETVFIGGAGA